LTQVVFCVLCYTFMKTIAVSEKAYTRLASWKTGRDDTFSAVIERLIPPKGTLDAALEAAESLPVLPSKEFESLENMVNATRKRLRASWK
jgi:predicted CopG family antitoxin